MADFKAIAGAGAALVRVLSAAAAGDLSDDRLCIRVCSRVSCPQPEAAGVSIVLYHVAPNPGSRIVPGESGGNDRMGLRELHLDLHFLLTFWGSDAEIQHRIAGWVMRRLEDVPVLGFPLLEDAAPGVFGETDVLEVSRADIPVNDLLRLWQVCAPDQGYQLSAVYTVRNLRIQSGASHVAGGAVRERVISRPPGLLGQRH